MNYATDGDLYVGWAEAVVHGRLSQPLERRYNVGSIFKRAQGVGRITRYEGLDAVARRVRRRGGGSGTAATGCPRRDWRASVIGDGLIMVRDPELQRVIEMTERFAGEFTMHAG